VSRRPLWLLLLVPVVLAVGAARGCGDSASPGTGPAGPLTIATGSTKGVYYRYAEAFASAAAAQLGEVRPLATTGSVENLRLLAAGMVTFAFTQADAAADAPPTPPMRAVARLYDDYMHLVVPAGSPVHAVADLRGLRVSVGPSGSGTALIADLILAAAQLDPARDVARQALSIDDSVLALEQRRIDAFFWSGGLPTSGVSELAAALPIRLVDLADPAAALRERPGAPYRTGTIPGATYPGVKKSVTTVAVPNLLVTLAATPAELVRRVVAALFATVGRISATVPSAGQLDERSSIFTGPVPLHEGAVAYFRSVKVQM
jgi:TRAP transporter TAXI family solute receptor